MPQQWDKGVMALTMLCECHPFGFFVITALHVVFPKPYRMAEKRSLGSTTGSLDQLDVQYSPQVSLHERARDSHVTRRKLAGARYLARNISLLARAWQTTRPPFTRESTGTMLKKTVVQH